MNQTINQRVTLVNASRRAQERARLKGWVVHPGIAKDLGDHLDNRIQFDWYTFPLVEVFAWITVGLSLVAGLWIAGAWWILGS